MNCTVLALAVALLIPLAAEAQKPRVQVEFDVAESDYVDLFTPAGLDSLRRDAARLIADTLEARLPVLEVTTAPPADYRLVVTVDRQDSAGVSPLQLDRGLYVQLVGPDSSTTRSWWTLFRPGGGTGTGLVVAGVPVRRTFLEQLRISLIKADFDDLVERHLSRVPIARSARRLDAPAPLGFGWVAPVVRDSLCLARGNPVRVLVLVPNPLDTVPDRRLYLATLRSDFDATRLFGDPPPQEWRALTGGVFAKPEPSDQPDLGFVQSDTSVVVTGIFLLQYDPAGRDLCRRVPTPTEAEARPGGGS